MGKIWNYDIEKTWDYENGFYLTSPFSRIAKSLAHWELYKKITHLPGDVVECGVFKGASLIRWATFREILENSSSRGIIGFDIFGEFPKTGSAEDNGFIERFENDSGNGIPYEELINAFEHKRFANYEFIKGDILQTIPEYISKHKELKIALLHIDVDVYAPTKAILEHLFDHVVEGGVVVFDDYGTVYGETKAVDEFMSDYPGKFKIEKLPYYKVPSYLVKKVRAD